MRMLTCLIHGDGCSQGRALVETRRRLPHEKPRLDMPLSVHPSISDADILQRQLLSRDPLQLLQTLRRAMAAFEVRLTTSDHDGACAWGLVRYKHLAEHDG